MTEAAAVETITLKEICEELGIKPTNARQKLRSKMKASKGEGFRWVFPVDQKDEIVELLKSKAEAKADDEDGEDDDE